MEVLEPFRVPLFWVAWANFTAAASFLFNNEPITAEITLGIIITIIIIIFIIIFSTHITFKHQDIGFGRTGGLG